MQDRGHGLRNFIVFLTSIGLLTFLYKERERLQAKVNDLVAGEEQRDEPIVGIDDGPKSRAEEINADAEPEIPLEELFEPDLVSVAPPKDAATADDVSPPPETGKVDDPEIREDSEPEDPDDVAGRGPDLESIEPEFTISDEALADFLEPTKERERYSPGIVPDDPTYSVRNPFADASHDQAEAEAAPTVDESADDTRADDAPTLDTSAATEATDDNGPTWVRPVDDRCPEGFPVKARFSTGHFHEPGDRGYDKIVPDCCYADAATAEADGFTPSRWS